MLHSKKCWVVSTQIWTNPNVGLKMQLTNLKLKVNVEVGLILNYISNQHLGLSVFDPNLGSNNPALFRVYLTVKEQYLMLGHSSC